MDLSRNRRSLTFSSISNCHLKSLAMQVPEWQTLQQFCGKKPAGCEGRRVFLFKTALKTQSGKGYMYRYVCRYHLVTVLLAEDIKKNLCYSFRFDGCAMVPAQFLSHTSVSRYTLSCLLPSPLLSDEPKQNISILKLLFKPTKSSEKLYFFLLMFHITYNLISTIFWIPIFTHFTIWAHGPKISATKPNHDFPRFSIKSPTPPRDFQWKNSHSPRCFCFKLGSKYDTCPFRVVDGTATTPGGEGHPK